MSDSTPDTPLKQCSRKDKCCSSQDGWLPATNEYFSICRKNRDGFHSQCKACDRRRKQSPEYKEQQRRHRQDPVVRERNNARLRQYYRDNAESQKQYARDRWLNNPEVRARAHQRNQQPEVKELNREYARKRRQDPEVVKREREYDRRRRQDPEKHDRELQYLRDRHKDPEFRRKKREYEQRPDVKAKQKERNRRKRLNPVFRERTREYNRRPEMRRLFAINATRRRARLISLPDTYTIDDYNRALEYFNGLCPICERPLADLFNERQPNADHWVPLSSPDCPGTVPKNMVILCGGVDGCNQSKGAKMPDVWLTERYGKRKAKQILKRIQDYFDSLT